MNASFDLPLAVPPRLLSVNLLHGCNLSCRFCSESSGPKHLRTAAQLPGRLGLESLATEQVYAILNQAAACGIQWIVFVGGEPTLRDDLPKLVRRATELGIKAGIITNGYRLASHPALASSLAAAGIHVVTFSWYGSTDAAASRVTGHARFRQRSLRGAEAVAAAGVRVAFNVVLTRENAAGFLDGSAWRDVERFAPAYVFLSPLMPAGRAGDPGDGSFSDGCSDLVLSPREYLDVYAQVRRRWESGAAAYPVRMPQAYVPLSEDARAYAKNLGTPLLQDRDAVSCRTTCGTKPEIRWDGRLNACCYFPYSERLTIGNVFESGLRPLLEATGERVRSVVGEAFTCPSYPDQIDGFGLGCPYRSALGDI
jgi:MoaA/NifB/PqqE/SkfB family radical SAM enzyme